MAITVLYLVFNDVDWHRIPLDASLSSMSCLSELSIISQFVYQTIQYAPPSAACTLARTELLLNSKVFKALYVTTSLSRLKSSHCSDIVGQLLPCGKRKVWQPTSRLACGYRTPHLGLVKIGGVGSRLVFGGAGVRLRLLRSPELRCLHKSRLIIYTARLDGG